MLPVVAVSWAEMFPGRPRLFRPAAKMPAINPSMSATPRLVGMSAITVKLHSHVVSAEKTPTGEAVGVTGVSAGMIWPLFVVIEEDLLDYVDAFLLGEGADVLACGEPATADGPTYGTVVVVLQGALRPCILHIAVDHVIGDRNAAAWFEVPPEGVTSPKMDVFDCHLVLLPR
jgi:hypothetical protein